MKKLSASEYDLTLRAKNGDTSANLELWEHYKPAILSILKKVPRMTTCEKLSEAYLVFLRKLDYFDSDKVLTARSPETFTFSYLLIGGIKNLKERLFNQLRKESANVSYADYNEIFDFPPFEKNYPFWVINTGNFEVEIFNEKLRRDLFEINNPANMTFHEDESLFVKERILYSKLTNQQKEILRLKQENNTLEEISKNIGCSVTTVKNQILIAKSVAAQIFGVRPELRIKLDQIKYGKKQLKQIAWDKQPNEINDNKAYRKAIGRIQKNVS